MEAGSCLCLLTDTSCCLPVEAAAKVDQVESEGPVILENQVTRSGGHKSPPG